MVLVSDAGHLAWQKERPVAGILPPVLRLAIAPHPDGGAVLFAFVPAVNVIAARIWSDDGSPFADLQILDIDACDALSASYVPGEGYRVVASRRGGARAQLLHEDGTLAWPRQGVDVADAGAWLTP
jgi:hypothetical protein